MAKASAARARRRSKTTSHGHDIIVIGASAGGVQALMEIAEGLPLALPAAVFVAIHTSPSGPGSLPQILNRTGRLPSAYAVDGQRIERGRIYLAPMDHHLLIKRGRVQVSRGPKENGFRPAVDPLFRTAAHAYGPRVIGIILSGGLDDGTSGLLEIKRYGGVAVVQDPTEAVFPSMPQSAILSVDVDHVVSLAQVPALLARLASEPAGKGAVPVPRDEAAERDIAEVGTSNLEMSSMKAPPSALTCPECGGALWEVENGKLLRYRCHLGHGYTGDSLNEHQFKHVEEALWTAMRTLEEAAAMRRRLADRTRNTNLNNLADHYDEQARQAEQRAQVIRTILVRDQNGGSSVPPTWPSEEARERAGDKPSSRPPRSGKKAKRRGSGGGRSGQRARAGKSNENGHQR